MEEQLAAGLGEGPIAGLVEDHEVETAEMAGEPTLPPVAGFAVELIDEVDDVEEAAAGSPRMQARAMPTARWVSPEPVPTTQHQIALMRPASSRTRVSLTG